MSEHPVAFGQPDLSDCDREPIHIPGSVQPHGALLAVERGSWRVLQAGGATQGLLGIEARELLGRDLTALLSSSETEALRAALPDRLARPQHLFTRSTESGPADIVAHDSDRAVILEFEPRLEPEPADSLTLVQAMIRRVHEAASVEVSYQAVVDEVRAASGFDRVMLYRFLADGSGAVEAEARHADVASYLGLRYPASDIPQQARALYLRNWIRVISDARYTAAPLFLEGTQTPLDLSLAALRSVSPIHLEYLANMGVVASMSLSIIIDGKLWGLVACHHRTPRLPPFRLRVALELFAQMASFQLETKLEAQDLGARLRQKTIGESLVAALSGETELAEGLRRFCPNLLDYIPADGVVLWLDGHFSGLGTVPAAKEVALLVRWLNESMADGVFHTDRLSDHYPPALAFADKASGMLALSVSRTPRDYVIWFRPELVQSVTWAGNPDKPAARAEQGRLSPRNSFAAWQEEVRLRSAPWSSLDAKTALALRISLLEVVLQHTDQLARERERSRIQQQALMAELDRRIAEWEMIASELKRESDRRAVLETQLSQVLRRTVLEQEAERQRIARELHDSLGQYLTVMQLDLDGIGREPEAGYNIRQRVERLKALTADVGQEVNHLAWEIRPTALDDLGLQTAFQQFLEEWAERSTLQFDVHLVLNDRRLPPAIETALYRVLQEAILNVIKHANASKVGVILEASVSEVRLIIEDDGKGFVWDDERGAVGQSDRLGLLGVRERLALVEGTLEVETAPGRGTTVLIHVAL